MSVATMSRVFWTDIKNLSYTESKGAVVAVQGSTCKLILLAIADNANDEGEQSWQSFDTIAKKSSLQKRSVMRAIRALIENKYLSLNGTSRYGTNNYTVNMDVLGHQPPRRTRRTSDSTSPVKDLTSDSEAQGSDREASPSDSEARTSDSTSPEPSLTVINPPTKEIKELHSTIWDIIKGEFDGDRYVPSQTKAKINATNATRIDAGRLIVASRQSDTDWLNEHVKRTAERLLPGISAEVCEVEFVTL